MPSLRSINRGLGKRCVILAEDQVDVQQFIQGVAAAQRSVLLLDYDGTLAPFQVDRQRALPYPGVVPMLQEIMASGHTRVVIVTGRTAKEILPLLRIHPHPEVWGAHGLQRLWPDGTCEIKAIDKEQAAALADASQWLSSVGFEALAEHKPGGIAVHWRGFPLPQSEEIRDRVLRGWLPIAQCSLLSIVEFDGGVEMRVSDIDKGDAVRAIAREVGGEIPIAYLGDDATDEQAFQALGTRGLSVLVGPEWRRTSARLWFKPPEDLLDFLSCWMEACYVSEPEKLREPLPSKDSL